MLPQVTGSAQINFSPQSSEFIFNVSQFLHDSQSRFHFAEVGIAIERSPNSSSNLITKEAKIVSQNRLSEVHMLTAREAKARNMRKEASKSISYAFYATEAELAFFSAILRRQFPQLPTLPRIDFKLKFVQLLGDNFLLGD